MAKKIFFGISVMIVIVLILIFTVGMLTAGVVGLLFLGITYYLLNKKNNNVDDPKNSNSNNNNSNQQNMAALNTNQIKILIWRPMTGGVYTKATEFYAEEKRDSNNNLIVINEDRNFKEDFNFNIDRVYEVMNFSLDMQNKFTKEKREILRDKIEEQKNLLLDIENDVSKNKDYNHKDEELKLRQMRIFYDSLNREKKGTYVRFGEGGIRQYEFVVIDGILFPYFFGINKFRAYPDLTLKKKVFNHENAVFRSETSLNQQSMINWVVIAALALGVLLCCAGAGMMYHAYNKSSDISMEVNQGAMTCTETLSKIQQEYGGIVQDYVESQKSQGNQNTNKETNSNNNNDDSGGGINNPIGDTINIDPGTNN